MLKPRVKICCINSVEEAQLAIKYGAAAIGLVGHMPSGPGVIEDELISRIARSTPPPISSFLLTSQTEPKEIIAHYSKVNTTTIQIVDKVENRDYVSIRKELPFVKLIQVIHVLDESSVEEAIQVSQHVDAILLDSGNPNLTVKELGGTGRVHNWELSRAIRESISIPIFLAGGLNSLNVRKAIQTVEPFGLDLCSSVRSNGKLDEAKLAEFFFAMEEAF